MSVDGVVGVRGLFVEGCVGVITDVWAADNTSLVSDVKLLW